MMRHDGGAAASGSSASESERPEDEDGPASNARAAVVARPGRPTRGWQALAREGSAAAGSRPIPPRRRRCRSLVSPMRYDRGLGAASPWGSPSIRLVSDGEGSVGEQRPAAGPISGCLGARMSRRARGEGSCMHRLWRTRGQTTRGVRSADPGPGEVRSNKRRRQIQRHLFGTACISLDLARGATAMRRGRVVRTSARREQVSSAATGD